MALPLVSVLVSMLVKGAVTRPSMPPSLERSEARRLALLAVGQALVRQSVLARWLCGVKLTSVLGRSVRVALAGVVKDLPAMVSSFPAFLVQATLSVLWIVSVLAEEQSLHRA